MGQCPSKILKGGHAPHAQYPLVSGGFCSNTGTSLAGINSISTRIVPAPALHTSPRLVRLLVNPNQRQDVRPGADKRRCSWELACFDTNRIEQINKFPRTEILRLVQRRDGNTATIRRSVATFATSSDFAVFRCGRRWSPAPVPACHAQQVTFQPRRIKYQARRLRMANVTIPVPRTSHVRRPILHRNPGAELAVQPGELESGKQRKRSGRVAFHLQDLLGTEELINAARKAADFNTTVRAAAIFRPNISRNAGSCIDGDW